MDEETGAAAPDTPAEPAASGHARKPAGGEAAKAVEALRFDLLRCALYHDMRQRRLLGIHRALLFLTVLLGSGAVAAFGAMLPIVGQLAGAAVAAVSAAQLVWDFAVRARDHEDLRRRFYNLLSDLEKGAEVTAITAEMGQLFADEPPMVDATNRKAHDRAGQALFGDDFVRADGSHGGHGGPRSR